MGFKRMRRSKAKSSSSFGRMKPIHGAFPDKKLAQKM